MKDLLPLLAHLLTTIAKLLGPGGARAVVADSLLMKQQLLIINRSRKRAPNLSTLDRFLLGFWSLFLNPRHILRAAVIIRPSTLLKFHNLLKQKKYRLLYSASRKGKPGPEGPSPELIQAIVELKQRNPRYGCPRIAQQINKVFGTDIDKDGHVVSSAAVSWKGTLIQYAGRLHRLHPEKAEVRIYDYVDRDVPMLARMFEKRLRGYRAIGYSTEIASAP